MNEIERAIEGLEYLIGGDCCDNQMAFVEEVELAIAVLREKQEREMGCEHCNNAEQRNDSGRVFYVELPHDARFLTTLDDAHLQIAFDRRSGWVLHFEDEDGFRMFDVQINFCPMCGKSLKEAANER